MPKPEQEIIAVSDKAKAEILGIVLQVDVEALEFVDNLIVRFGLTSSLHPVELRVGLAASVKEFCARRMRARLIEWLDEDLPTEQA